MASICFELLFLKIFHWINRNDPTEEAVGKDGFKKKMPKSNECITIETHLVNEKKIEAATKMENAPSTDLRKNVHSGESLGYDADNQFFSKSSTTLLGRVIINTEVCSNWRIYY